MLSLLDLPQETLERIVCYLDVAAVGSLDSTCRQLRQACVDFWGPLEQKLVNRFQLRGDRWGGVPFHFASTRQRSLFLGQYDQAGRYFEDLALYADYYNQSLPAAIQFEWDEERTPYWTDGKPNRFLYAVRVSRYIEETNQAVHMCSRILFPCSSSSSSSFNELRLKFNGGDNETPIALKAKSIREACLNWMVTVTAISRDRPGPPRLVLSSFLNNNTQRQQAPHNHMRGHTATDSARQKLISDFPVPIDPEHPGEASRDSSLQIHLNEAAERQQGVKCYSVQLLSLVVRDLFQEDEEDDDYEDFAVAAMHRHDRSVTKQKEEKLNQGRWRHRWRGRRK